jgi:hypothetical protein
MRCVISTTHDQQYDDLAKIVVPNHIRYCRKHGYEYNLHHAPFKSQSTYSNSYLSYVKYMLYCYDVIVTIDLDLMFINQNVTIDSIFPECFDQQIASEKIGGCDYNSGVVLWRNTKTTCGLLDEIIYKRVVYEKDCMNWQGQLCNLIREQSPLIAKMNKVDEHVMNTFNRHWKDGDFIVHFYMYQYADKIRLANEYLQKVSG